MKTIITTVIIIISFVFSCKAQLMQTLNDADKIQENKDYYAGKQFKVLLKDIGPEIKAYIILPDSTYTKAGGVSLIFLTPSEYMRINFDAKTSSDRPTTVSAYLTDIDAVNRIIKDKRGRGAWTKELADSLGCLIIRRAYAYGSDVHFISKPLPNPKPPYTTRPDTVIASPNK